MDKNAIKKYAVWARRELISRVSQRAELYEITTDGFGDQYAVSVHGRILSDDEKKQRVALITQIREKGYEQVMEEIAYTWFNRFSALRFMEVNGYLPTRVRVFTDEENSFKPQIMTEAINMELDDLDMQKVYELKNANDDDELFKYMIIVQCNSLSSILPGMFQKIADYTELLFPDNLLREGSVVEQMITMIPQEDWTDQVQIIGWLYEGYNTERNELVYDGNMAKARITKDLLPAATTIFTPDWPIRYMVENSLGRLWIEGHPNDKLKAEWKYYLDEAEQEPAVQLQLDEIRKEYAELKPEDIRVIDPCQGSGHILAYMFEVLVQIYEAYGYSIRDAVASIVEHNIWGLDIDERAAQLAYFSVMMKARQYDRRFFSRGIQPHAYVILESNNLDPHCIEYFVEGSKELKSAMDTLVYELHDAKEYGSILSVTQVDYNALYERFEKIQNAIIPGTFSRQSLDELYQFVQVAQVMAQKYHIIVTNPPYLSNARFSSKLDSYVKKNYTDVKADLSMVMYKHAIDSFASTNGLIAFITTSSWMFLKSFEKMREYAQSLTTFSSIVDFGTELFEGKVGHNPIVSWVTRKCVLSAELTAIRLVDYCYSRRDEKESEFFDPINHYSAKQESFSKIPGSPIAYWVSQSMFNTFDNPSIQSICTQKTRISTGDNDRFMRKWYEIESSKMIYPNKWVPCPKGGDYRKWYGNIDLVLNWENDGEELKEFPRAMLGDQQYFMKPGLTWTVISSTKTGFRIVPEGCICDHKGPLIFVNDDNNTKKLLGLLNSRYSEELLKVTAPTMGFEWGAIAKTPWIGSTLYDDIIDRLVSECMSLSKEDWDAFETSWDFQRHPLIEIIPKSKRFFERVNIEIADCYMFWESKCEERFNKLKANEEELNRVFIEVYGLQDELTPEVKDKDVTVRRADLKREVRSFISYAVGCMFGRYSLDVPGLVYAGGSWDTTKYKTFLPDKDAIIPICDDEYFKDDIVGRFVRFVEVVYGEETLEENLRFIADALGGKGSSREVIRNYFINGFYSDHVKIFQKRPIYWLFDSGKKNGFKCLIYMHRYQSDTIARIRTDYVHEQQSRYRTAIADLESRVANAGTGERVKLTKRLDSIKAQAEELRIYEEKIHHLADQMIRIDLDDGVKANYAKFQDVLAKIK